VEQHDQASRTSQPKKKKANHIRTLKIRGGEKRRYRPAILKPENRSDGRRRKTGN